MPQGVSFFEGSQQESTVQIKNAPGLSGKGGGEHSTARGVIFSGFSQLSEAKQKTTRCAGGDKGYTPKNTFSIR